MASPGQKNRPESYYRKAEVKEFVNEYVAEQSLLLDGCSESERICEKFANEARELFKKKRKEQDRIIMEQVSDLSSNNDEAPKDFNTRKAEMFSQLTNSKDNDITDVTKYDTIACTPSQDLCLAGKYVKHLVNNRKSAAASMVYQLAYQYKMRECVNKLEADLSNERKLREEMTPRLEEGQDSLDGMQQLSDANILGSEFHSSF